MSESNLEINRKPKDLVEQKVPKLDERQIAWLEDNISGLRKTVKKFNEYYLQFKDLNGESFEKISKEIPGLPIALESIDKSLRVLSDRESLSDQEILDAINEYNFHAEQINKYILQIELLFFTDPEQDINFLNKKDFEFIESKLTDEQKKEIKEVARTLWNEIFPETNIDRFVKNITKQEDLDGYQRILLSPANGIEFAVKGFLDLFKLSTYEEMYRTIKILYDWEPDDFANFVNGGRFIMRQLDTTDKVAPALSLIYSFAFLLGGRSKLIEKINKINKFNISQKVILDSLILARSVSYAKDSSNLILIGAMTGLTLPYIKN